MVRFILVFILLLCTSASAYDGWSGERKVNSVRVYSASHVLITVTAPNNPGECASTEYLVLNNADTEAGMRMYSALLSAYTTGKNVTLALTGCSSGDKAGWPLIEQVWLK